MGYYFLLCTWHLVGSMKCGLCASTIDPTIGWVEGGPTSTKYCSQQCMDTDIGLTQVGCENEKEAFDERNG